MRVLMFSWEYPPRVVGGLARHVHDLSVALAAGGTEVDVITVDEDGTAEPEEIMNGVRVLRIKPYHLVPRDFISGILQLNLTMLEKTLSLFQQGESYDLIHAHDWLVAYAARAVKHAARLPLVATIHATEYGRNRGLHTDEQRYISDVEWWLTYEAWKVICCSRYMYNELQTVFHLPDDKIETVPNGVDPRQFVAGRHDSTVRERFAAADEKIVFFIGRLVQEKGVHVLLDAAPRILAAEPKTKFVIAGKGPALESLRSQARQMGIENRIYFTGYIDDHTRNALYQSASVAVFPSLYEPFGIVALEGMAANVPVVVSETGGLGDIVEHGIDGLKCFPGDAASLADQVISLLANESSARNMAEQALQKIKKQYSWQEIAGQTRNIYQQVLAEFSNCEWSIPHQEMVAEEKPRVHVLQRHH
ncbi:glycosyltransferase family 4 protein [Dethiobacter alkaliphilus]|uniref:Glycosyl transferase group 1 n=1 Tax=Dethiobacter alkaliphilus AHT 1 TaxID=555088 RepID=C0GEN8_DETAL|nr:glycosyltransferase family 4 protein [Dethiobacter alkaliphilus]EEG78070.1 glycosyl transferase group 1 [Dethiobacter alkaliphilus AHT 1]